MRTCVCILASSLIAAAVTSAAMTGQAAKTSAQGIPLELGPYVRYTTPSEAVVTWWTTEPGPSILEYGLAGPGAKYSPSIQLQGAHQGKLENRLEHQRAKKRHAMKIKGLRPNEVYAYRVKTLAGGTERSTDVYELDTALNYSVRPLPTDVPFSENAARDEKIKAVVHEIRRQGFTQGYCLVWGLVDGCLAHALAANTELTVIGLDDDASRIAAIRQRLYKAGIYGTRISVQHVERLAGLPFPSNFANLIVSERLLTEGRCSGPAAEMFRLLRPRDSAAVFRDLASESRGRSEAIERWLRSSSVVSRSHRTDVGLFYVVEKPVSPGIGSWTHQYGDAGNTADSHDDLGGARGTDDLRIQWLGKPGADFGADRNPRMPAPLAANGRLFHQGMNRMVAVDVYNGSILWSLEIPSMQRVNLPRDASNWCTDNDMVYTAIQDRCWALDHRSGNLKHAYELPEEWANGQWDWGYVARQDSLLIGSAVKKGMVYTDFWGGPSWYDKTSGYGTGKVCSDAMFAYDLDTGNVIWKRRSGLVINTTIALDDNAIVFVESRNDELKNAQTRRLNDSHLWSQQYLVSLDPRTGRSRWETPIDTVDGIVVFFLAYRDDAIVITSSAAGHYHLYKFDANDGKQLWHAQHKWPSDNHGGHMQHPVVLADRVYLEPCGYDLKTGDRITAAMSGREGCATYCGTKHVLVHRGQSRRVAIWDFTTGKITSWQNLRPSCWLSTVAGEGMVLSPEGGGGCSCGNWLETSLVFAPRGQTATAQVASETK